MPHILSSALCLLTVGVQLSPPAMAQMKHYFKDADRKTVELGADSMLGERRGEEIHLSESQAVEMALTNNLDVNVERHRPLIAFHEVEFAESIYEPFMLFGLNWARDKVPTGSVLAGGGNVTDVITDYQFGYRQDFSSGTRFEADFGANRNRSTNSFASLVPALSTNISLTLRQNLLRGYGRSDDDYRIEISRNDLELSRREFETLLANVILRVQESFWDLRFALDDIQVQEKSLELAQTILDQNRARFEVGAASRLEVIEAEAELAARREQLIRARFNYRLAQDDLVTLITHRRDPRDLGGDIVPADSVHQPEPPSSGFEELLSEAVESRSELGESHQKIESLRVELDRSRNRLKPTLDLLLGYRRFGLGGRQVIRDFSGGFVDAPIVEINPGGLADSLDQLFGANFYGYVVALDFQLPLGNKSARARSAQAQIALDEEKMRWRSLEQGVALELRQALTNLEMNQARVDAALATVRLERERLDGQQSRFEVGLSTTRQLIEAQRDLVVAESVLLRNRVDLIKTRKRLDRALGRTLREQRIDVSDALSANVR